MSAPFDFRDARLVLAGTCYGEARGGGGSGMADVASVVLNRVATGWDGATTVVGVCLQPWQFSCWNAADPNRREILAAAAGGGAGWREALAAADAALAGAPDHTGGADSYFATGIAPPYWAHPPATHTATRWLHSFWVTRRPAPPVSAHGLTTAELNDASAAGTLTIPGARA